MNKLELKKQIRDNLKTDGRINIKDVNEIVDEVFNVIMDNVSKGEDVTITGFGKFTTSEVKDHYGRNPQKSYEVIKVPNYRRVRFHSGKKFKNKIKK